MTVSLRLIALCGCLFAAQIGQLSVDPSSELALQSRHAIATPVSASAVASRLAPVSTISQTKRQSVFAPARLSSYRTRSSPVARSAAEFNPTTSIKRASLRNDNSLSSRRQLTPPIGASATVLESVAAPHAPTIVQNEELQLQRVDHHIHDLPVHHEHHSEQPPSPQHIAPSSSPHPASGHSDMLTQSDFLLRKSQQALEHPLSHENQPNVVKHKLSLFNSATEALPEELHATQFATQQHVEQLESEKRDAVRRYNKASQLAREGNPTQYDYKQTHWLFEHAQFKREQEQFARDQQAARQRLNARQAEAELAITRHRMAYNAMMAENEQLAQTHAEHAALHHTMGEQHTGAIHNLDNGGASSSSDEEGTKVTKRLNKKEQAKLSHRKAELRRVHKEYATMHQEVAARHAQLGTPFRPIADEHWHRFVLGQPDHKMIPALGGMQWASAFAQQNGLLKQHQHQTIEMESPDGHHHE